LGRVPRFQQTDHSTAATHNISSGGRGFNAEYLALMRHLGTEPRTTAVGAKEQNGSVEASNGAFKRAVEQELLLRGSRDFESVDAYRAWLEGILKKHNARRGKRLEEEIQAMRPLSVRRLPAYSIVDARVGTGSTIRVKGNTYSVPSRLIGEMLRVRVHDDRLEMYLGGELQAHCPRVRGKKAFHVAWRDVIGSMVRKPGAFRRYRYREALFPSAMFRRAWERLDEALPTWSADMNYLQTLQFAGEGSQHDVECALERLEQADELPLFKAVAALAGGARPERPEVRIGEVELSSYDALTPATIGEVVR
jgi:hypothetical protein